MAIEFTQDSVIKPEKKKRGRPPKPFVKGDKRINAGGRPKHNITYWMNFFGHMTPDEAAKFCEVYADELRRVGGTLSINGLIAVRVLTGLIDDPNSGILAQVLDRTEGKVALPIEWREAAIKAGLNPDELLEKAEKVVDEYIAGLDNAGSDSGDPPAPLARRAGGGQ